jgi:hypothetical protein
LVLADWSGSSAAIAHGGDSLARKGAPRQSGTSAIPCLARLRYALKGNTERTAAELTEARRLNSDDRYSSIARSKAITVFGLPKVCALSEATYFAGLRLAEVPEE